MGAYVGRSVVNVAVEMESHRPHSSWPEVVSVLVSRCSEFGFRYDMNAIAVRYHSFLFASKGCMNVGPHHI
jgi:hypothetical protein